MAEMAEHISAPDEQTPFYLRPVFWILAVVGYLVYCRYFNPNNNNSTSTTSPGNGPSPAASSSSSSSPSSAPNSTNATKSSFFGPNVDVTNAFVADGATVKAGDVNMVRRSTRGGHTQNRPRVTNTFVSRNANTTVGDVNMHSEN